MLGKQENSEYHTTCLHHNDTDGRASAAVVRKALGTDVWLCEMDYGDPLPLERILSSDHIIIVDFSLSKDEMIQLATYHQFTWIDHHQSAIQELAEAAEPWPGIRDTGDAACVLTWKYFFPNVPVPTAVTLIGDRDVWRWAKRETGPFNEGLYQLDTRPFNDTLWIPLLENNDEVIGRIIQNGTVLRDARLRSLRQTIMRQGFPALIEDHRALVVNLSGSGDIGQLIRDMGYEIAYCYVDQLNNGEIITYVTLYASGIDVSEIAIRFGGGGHKGAAGFHFVRERSPFPPGLKISIE